MGDAEPQEQVQEPVEPAVLTDAPVEGAVVGEVEDFKPAPGDLVIANPYDDSAVLQVLDRHDELAILERVQHKMTDKLIYSFNAGGGRVTELSVQGVMECVGEMNATGKVKVAIDRSIRPEWERELMDTDFGPDIPHISCTVYARDEVTEQGVNGTFSQPLKFKLTEKTAGYRKKDGKYVPDDLIMSDPFARQKALNKAERNALRKMVPEFIAQTLIAHYLGDARRVQAIKAGPGAKEVAELPPPLTDDRARAQVAEARALYVELMDADPGGLRTRVPPAYFHSLLTRAEHSHDRLADFIRYMEGKVAEAKGGGS